jgi:hypothetical protein
LKRSWARRRLSAAEAAASTLPAPPGLTPLAAAAPSAGGPGTAPPDEPSDDVLSDVEEEALETSSQLLPSPSKTVALERRSAIEILRKRQRMRYNLGTLKSCKDLQGFCVDDSKIGCMLVYKKTKHA